MGSEHFKGEPISVHVCENVLISTKLSHLKLNSNFWFNLDNFETNKALVPSLIAIVITAGVVNYTKMPALGE